jgi:hypothetical protein
MTYLDSFSEAFLFGFVELITKPDQQPLAQWVGEFVADDAEKVSQQTLGAVCSHGESAF